MHTHEAFAIWKDRPDRPMTDHGKRVCCMCEEPIEYGEMAYVINEHARTLEALHLYQCISRYDLIFKSTGVTLHLSSVDPDLYFKNGFNARTMGEAFAVSEVIKAHLRDIRFQWDEYSLFENNVLVRHVIDVITFSL